MRWVVIIWTVACVVWVVSGIDRAQQSGAMDSDAGQAGAGLGLMLVVMIWAVVAGALGVIGLLFRKR